jgi:hypothetical protein
MIRDFESALLVTDETEGCMRRAPGAKKLSIPHTASLIDLDGDCLSDFFITVTDVSSGKTYYEIYLRREREVTQSGDEDGDQDDKASNNTSNYFKGLNSFCLVSREEVPSLSNNLFYFADLDRDAMVDMLFATKNDLSLHIYYNKLVNLQTSQ